MGKWSMVPCNCPNRLPLHGSRWGAYECGHKDGAAVAFAPNDLIGYGADLGRIYHGVPSMFEVWRRLGDWRQYNDEYLRLTVDEAMLWELEIEQLRQFLSGDEFMGWKQLQLWNRLREDERRYQARIGHEPTPVSEVLDSGLLLCRVCSEMGTSIEFFW